MANLWIIVADKSKARFFTVTEEDALQEAAVLEHPEARDLEQSLKTDKPGRSFDSNGQGRHAMGSHVEPDEHETRQFAKHVGEYLRNAHNAGKFIRLMLVAGSPMLGLLREELKTLSGVNVSEVDKNLGQYNAREVRTHLPKRL